MTTQHIGEDFSSVVRLNLLPGIKLPRGIYQLDIRYISATMYGNSTINHISQNMLGNSPPEFTVIVGADVYEISVHIRCHNSYPSNPLINYMYTMRVDRLLLLNLAVELLSEKL